MKIFPPKTFGNIDMQTLASFVNQNGIAFGADNSMQKSLPALPGTQRLGAGQVAALGDVSPVVSSQDSQVESPCMSQSPTKKPRLAADTPQSFLEKAKELYAPGPADPAMPAAATHTAANPTRTEEPAALPPPPLQNASTKPKLMTVVKKTNAAKPDKLPARPTHTKFPVFRWGPYKIYNGGPRSAYRVSSAPGSRDTKFLKTWADVLKHLQCN